MNLANPVSLLKTQVCFPSPGLSLCAWPVYLTRSFTLPLRDFKGISNWICPRLTACSFLWNLLSLQETGLPSIQVISPGAWESPSTAPSPSLSHPIHQVHWVCLSNVFLIYELLSPSLLLPLWCRTTPSVCRLPLIGLLTSPLPHKPALTISPPPHSRDLDLLEISSSSPSSLSSNVYTTISPGHTQRTLYLLTYRATTSEVSSSCFSEMKEWKHREVE